VTKNKHYAFDYIGALQKTAANPSGPEPDRTNEILDACEDDFDWMAQHFPGVDLTPTFGVPISVHITNQGGGATWGPPIDINANGVDANGCRTRLVAEVTEMFMKAQKKGWYAPDDVNKQSCGEGLSQFFAQEFQKDIGVPPTSQWIWRTWLNTSSDQKAQLGGP
jgi:hypothetical protein